MEFGTIKHRAEGMGQKLDFGRRTRRRPIERDYGAARMGKSEERNLKSENINTLYTLCLLPSVICRRYALCSLPFALSFRLPHLKPSASPYLPSVICPLSSVLCPPFSVLSLTTRDHLPIKSSIMTGIYFSSNIFMKQPKA